MEYDHCRYWLEVLSLDDNSLKKLSTISIAKGSGKGGQKINKTSNAVTWKFYRFLARSHKSRQLKDNLHDCFRKIQMQIAINIVPSIEERPKREALPQLLKKYYQAGKYQINQHNHEYAFLSGYLVDLMCQYDEEKELLSLLHLSRSQLSKWLKQHPLLYQKYVQINQARNG